MYISIDIRYAFVEIRRWFIPDNVEKRENRKSAAHKEGNRPHHQRMGSFRYGGNKVPADNRGH